MINIDYKYRRKSFKVMLAHYKEAYDKSTYYEHYYGILPYATEEDMAHDEILTHLNKKYTDITAPNKWNRGYWCAKSETFEWLLEANEDYLRYEDSIWESYSEAEKQIHYMLYDYDSKNNPMDLDAWDFGFWCGIASALKWYLSYN